MSNIQNIQSSYGLDVEEELTKMLSEQLAREIDKQIIKELFHKKNLRKEKIDRIYGNRIINNSN